MLISSLGFAVVNSFVKTLTHIPSHELVFFRSVVSFAICFYTIRKLKLPFFGNNKPWLLLRGVSGSLALFMFFFTLKGTTFASAVTLQYLSPVFTVILAMFLMGEKVKKLQWFFFAVAFGGIVCIKGFDDNQMSTSVLLLGIASAVCSGIAYNCILKCKATDHPITVVMYFPLVAIPLFGTMSIYDWVSPQGWREWCILLVIGVFTQVAQVSMTRAFQLAPASKVTPFKYFGAIWAILIGYFVFSETLVPLSMIGIALVLFGVLANAKVKAAPKAGS